MPYDHKKLYETAIKQAKKQNVFFIEDIVALMPCAKPTFYDHFPIGSNELNSIKEILYKNKASKKMQLRGKLFRGKGTELLALYKLIATEEERKSLSLTYQENKQEVKINRPTIEAADNEQQKKIEELIKKFNEGH